jgi:hypothetical protein
MNRMSSTCQRLYSELLQACLRGAAPSGRGLSFVSKKIDGKKHWYLQFTVGSRKTQHYLGPDREDTRARIAEEKQLWENAAPELSERRRMVALVAQAGGLAPTTAEGRVLEVLERTGAFRVGGTLVGSMAFRQYGNMLGVVWSSGVTSTEDVDVAQDDRIPVGVGAEPGNLSEALRESGLGSVEVPALDRKSPSTSFKIRGQQFSVDLLTPMRGKSTDRPLHVPTLDAMAKPVRFLDYLLKDIQPAAVVSGAGILVNVPAPGRFALHKLVVAERRPAAWQAKADKDIAQAAELLDVLLESRPGDLLIAQDAADTMPSAFRKALDQGKRKLPGPLRVGLEDLLKPA